MKIISSATRLKLRLAQVLVFLMLLVNAGIIFAASIGGEICKGAKLADGTPQTACEPVIGATVMVQDTHGNFVAYGDVTPNGNAWNATVPPGEYVAVYSAPGFDATSREFLLDVDCGAACQSYYKNAYLPQLPLPTANLLVYTFIDNYVNSEDDFPADTPLAGVTLILMDDDGVEVARGVTGSQTMALMPPGAGPDIAGLFYFTNLKPGDYVVVPDMSTLPASPSGNGWYMNMSAEGTYEWEVSLYPGDPGTVDGGYMSWFSFVPRLSADLPPSADPNIVTGTITGRLMDADGPWFPLEEPFNPPQADLVTPNWYVPHGLVVLFSKNGIIQPDGTTKLEPIATAEAQTGTPEQTAMGEADPVTGKFTFSNVPPGPYTMFVVDALSENPAQSNIPKLSYIWQEKAVTVTPGGTVYTEVFLPRWFARIHGTVMDTATGLPIEGARVRLRVKDGSIWKETVTGVDGKYNFDELSEVEVLGYVDAEPPLAADGSQKYRGVVDAEGFNLATRTVQWYACNYKADLQFEQIPPTDGVVSGFVYNDELATGTWVPDGFYQPYSERTMHGEDIELLDEFGNPVLDAAGLPVTAKTGKVNNASLEAQGWLPPYVTYPPDEFGGVYRGYIPGYYEFRGLPAGNYQVRHIVKNGSFSSPAGTEVQMAAVESGIRKTVNFGINTLAPLSGEIEGGVFDDINLDTNTWSVMWDEKKAVVGAKVGIYDHNGYLLGSGEMGNPLCHPKSPYLADFSVCPGGLPQKPEVERHAVHGPHIYVGNDPALPGFIEGYEALPWTYNFGQGKYKFEADWSLLPITAIPMGNGDPGQLLPQNPPVIANAAVVNAVAPIAFDWSGNMLAMNGYTPVAAAAPSAGTDAFILKITGTNFGASRGYSTVTLAGRKLDVLSWSDTAIEAALTWSVVSGPAIVATSTGISNAVRVRIDTPFANKAAAVSTYVNANALQGGNGTKASPYQSIQQAIDSLPAGQLSYIYVAPGTYNENVKITHGNVHIIGSGPDVTIVNARKPLRVLSTGIEQGGAAFSIGRGGLNGGVSNVMISGFTVKGGSVRGGIFSDYGNSVININNSVIVNNSGEYGGGIWLHKSNQSVNIWSNIIARNGNTGGYGGGISVNDEPEYGTGGASYGSANHHTADDNKPAPTTSYNIFNNLIYQNFSMDYGGGICLYEAKDNLNVYGNVIMENRSEDHGGGLFFEDSGPANIYGNKILRNYAADDGGAISMEDVGDLVATVNIYNNLIAENIADDRGESTARGGAIALDDTFYVSIYSNTITGNIVAGALNPAGGAIDSERNGHEYLAKAPGYSDPKIYNNIIWNNWRLNYDMPVPKRGGEFGVADFTMGVNYRWSPDNLHVDNPALQADWQSEGNSESFTSVHYNDINGGYMSGVGNVDIDPLFVNPLGLDWRLTATSPVLDAAPYSVSPKLDIELNKRVPAVTVNGKRVEMGAYELILTQSAAYALPAGISGSVIVPRP